MQMVTVSFAGSSTAWAETFISRDQSGDINISLTMEMVPRSDIISAKAIRDHYPDMISYGTQTGQWYLWDGAVHKPSNGGDIERLIHEWAYTLKVALDLVQDHYELQAASAPDQATADRIMKTYREDWKLHRQYRDRAFNDSGQKAVISQLKSMCAVDESEFDSTPQYFVCENGVINLNNVMKSGEVKLLPHDPSRKLTMRSSVVWDPESKCEWWEWYLGRSLPDPEVRQYLQRWAGSAILGKPNSKGLVNLIGPQDSGKSIFIDTLLNVTGDYSKMVRSSTFLAKKAGDAGYEMHELRGARLVTASEPGAGKYLDDDAVKTITGNDFQRTREPYGRFVAWKPQCTIFIASNQPMRLDTADGALLNRIKPIRFPKSFSRDPDAPPELRAEPRLGEYLGYERSGILRWLISGLLAFRDQGLGEEPESVRQARIEMSIQIDVALEWLDEMVTEGTILEVGGDVPLTHCMTTASAFTAFTSWCDMNRERNPPGRNKFISRIGRVHPVKKSYGRRFTGLQWCESLREQMEN